MFADLELQHSQERSKRAAVQHRFGGLQLVWRNAEECADFAVKSGICPHVTLRNTVDSNHLDHHLYSPLD